jgi:YidC/Oxa1 family membrane protein insertase
VSDNSSEYNQRSMRAIILCVMVAIVYTQFFLTPPRSSVKPVGETVPQQQVSQSAPAGSVVQSTAVPVGAVQAVPPVVQSHPNATEIAAAPVSSIDTGMAIISVTHLGARLSHYRLKDFKKELSREEALDLIDSSTEGALPLGMYAGVENDERVVYSLAAINGAAPSGQAINLKLEQGGRAVVDFKGTLASGIQVTKRYTFTEGSFLFGVDVLLDRPVANGYPVLIEWTHYYSAAVEKSLRVKHSITLLDAADKIKHVPIESIAPGAQDFGATKWAALGDTYFASIIIPGSAGQNSSIGREGDVFYTRVAGSPSGGQFYSYVGPKDYNTLERSGGFSLERSVDLGWFSFLALPLLWLLRALYMIFGNYGVAIIGLTLLVKAVMLPLSKASFQSAKKMQDLQPEIKVLRERIKDPTQLNQEMFALYKRKGVNPMGGCFPVLIQIPVFLGLYNALLNALELRHARYALWITDLSAPESLHLFGIGVPVMVLLMAASMVYQTWTTPNPSADPTQQKMMMIMPLVFAGMFIVFPMPAGLVLYWLVNNIISIIQQLYMRSSKQGSVYVGTAVASIAIFGLGYLLTLI